MLILKHCGKCKVLIFLRVWSFYSHALYIFSQTVLGDAYRIPEKSSNLSTDKINRTCESKDQTPKKIRTLYFPETRDQNIIPQATQRPSLNVTPSMAAKAGKWKPGLAQAKEDQNIKRANSYENESAGPKRGSLNLGAWNPQESGRKAPLSCNAAFSMLHCSFPIAAAQLFV